MSSIIFKTKREGYDTNQCGKTLTVQELIDILSGYDPESKIYYSNDNGYTYGSIKEYDIDEKYEAEDKDEE